MTDAARDLISRAGHVHGMGSSFAIPGIGRILSEAILSVKARGGTVSFDPNVRKELVAGQGEVKERFNEVLSVTDLLLPSGEEHFVAAGIDDEAGAVEALLSRGIVEIVLKRGPSGSSFYRRSERGDCPAFKVDELDPTGAGDCFGATYVTCRRKGRSPAVSLRYANAAGARTVMKQGPMGGVSTFAELDQFI